MRKLPLPPFFVKSDNLVFHHKPCFSESQNTAGLQSGSTPPLFCWITPDMMLIFGLMLLLETAACVEFNCSFNQSGPCNAVLGDELRLKMVDSSKNDLRIHKRIYNTPDDPFCKIKNDRIKKECDLFKNRPVSVSNGILVINSVIRADSGIYSLQVFNSLGEGKPKADLQVIVEGTNDPATIAIVLGCLAVVLILLVIVAYYFYKKKNQLKPTRNVEYATVSSQNKMKMKEEEIHYGEVTFMSSSVQRPRQTHDDCVYSEVHTR